MRYVKALKMGRGEMVAVLITWRRWSVKVLKGWGWRWEGEKRGGQMGREGMLFWVTNW